jgi:hypothetical protein
MERMRWIDRCSCTRLYSGFVEFCCGYGVCLETGAKWFVKVAPHDGAAGGGIALVGSACRPLGGCGCGVGFGQSRSDRPLEERGLGS